MKCPGQTDPARPSHTHGYTQHMSNSALAPSSIC